MGKIINVQTKNQNEQEDTPNYTKPGRTFMLTPNNIIIVGMRVCLIACHRPEA